MKQICKNCVFYRKETRLYGLCFECDLLLAVANDETCDEWLGKIEGKEDFCDCGEIDFT